MSTIIQRGGSSCVIKQPLNFFGCVAQFHRTTRMAKKSKISLDVFFQKPTLAALKDDKVFTSCLRNHQKTTTKKNTQSPPEGQRLIAYYRRKKSHGSARDFKKVG